MLELYVFEILVLNKNLPFEVQVALRRPKK